MKRKEKINSLSIALILRGKRGLYSHNAKDAVKAVVLSARNGSHTINDIRYTLVLECVIGESYVVYDVASMKQEDVLTAIFNVNLTVSQVVAFLKVSNAKLVSHPVSIPTSAFVAGAE